MIINYDNIEFLNSIVINSDTEHVVINF